MSHCLLATDVFPGQDWLVEAAGSCYQLMALRVALCVENTMAAFSESVARVQKGERGKELGEEVE